ncbi:MAG: NusG domain II-containing protein [Clostridiales bacterium]|nr:NusG domain II-containing protein [Clostridiales bacterium]
MKVFKKGDILLIITILALSIFSIFMIPKFLTTPEGGKEVVVFLDGEEIHRFPLENTPESKYIDFPFEVRSKEYIGRLEMKDGYVRLHRLSEEISPLSIHTDMGWISESYQMIVSLPIRMYITIEETSPNFEHPFDAIVQ